MYIPPSRVVFGIFYSKGIKNFSIENKDHWVNSYLDAYDSVKYKRNGSLPTDLKLSKPSCGKRRSEAIQILETLLDLNSFEGLAYSNGLECNLDISLTSTNYYSCDLSPKLINFSEKLAKNLMKVA